MEGSNEPEQSSGIEDGVSPGPNVGAIVPALFSSSTPKNAWRGAISGVADFAGYSVVAVAVAVGAPVAGGKAGYEKAGVLGSVGGVLAGVVVGAVAAAGITLAGAVSCAYQTIVGLIRTPAAFVGMASGQRWDADAEKWVPYDLQSEADKLGDVSDETFVEHVNVVGDAKGFYKAAASETIEQLTEKVKSKNGIQPGAGSGREQARGGDRGSCRGTVPVAKKNVVDKELYNVLGVEPEATPSEIKKAYYVRAREKHPDRNPGNNQAKEEFQKIGQAYQVLADEKLRREYDSKGKSAAVGAAPSMDAGFLYTMLFGNEHFEDLIGELSMSTSIKVMTDNTKPSEFVRFRQRKRELDCALKLAAKLALFVDGDEEEFERRAHEEADSLCEVKLGATLLAVIGQVYIEQARASVSTADSVFISLKHMGENLSSSVTKVTYGIRSLFGAAEMNKIHTQAEQRKLEAEKQEILALPDGEEKERRLAEIKNKTAAQKQTTMGTGGGLDSMCGPNPSAAEKSEVNEKIKSFTGNIFGVLWQMTLADIRSTLKHVCKLVIRDVSVTPATTEKRTIALKKLGEIYVSKFVDEGTSMADLLQRMGAQTGLYDPTGTETANPAAAAAAETETETGMAGEEKEKTDKQQFGSSSAQATKVFTRQELVNMISMVPDYSTRELKGHIAALGGDSTSCIEKADLVTTLNDILCDRLTHYPEGGP